MFSLFKLPSCIETNLKELNLKLLAVSPEISDKHADQLNTLLQDEFESLYDPIQQKKWLIECPSYEKIIYLVNEKDEVRGFCRFSECSLFLLTVDKKYRKIGLGSLLFGIAMVYANHLHKTEKNEIFSITTETEEDLIFYRKQFGNADPRVKFNYDTKNNILTGICYIKCTLPFPEAWIEATCQSSYRRIILPQRNSKAAVTPPLKSASTEQPFIHYSMNNNLPTFLSSSTGKTDSKRKRPDDKDKTEIENKTNSEEETDMPLTKRATL